MLLKALSMPIKTDTSGPENLENSLCKTIWTIFVKFAWKFAYRGEFEVNLENYMPLG